MAGIVTPVLSVREAVMLNNLGGAHAGGEALSVPPFVGAEHLPWTHDSLRRCQGVPLVAPRADHPGTGRPPGLRRQSTRARSATRGGRNARGDRKSTRLNSSHVKISYAVFCLK